MAVVGAFVGFLWLIGVQIVWPFLPPGATLMGVAPDPPAPRWDWSSLRHGETLRAVDAWYTAHVGMRNRWVRLDNQINYSVFSEIAYRGVGTEIVAGPHDWLFERVYLRDSVQPADQSEAELSAFTRQIRSVQDKLGRRGIPFLYVVAPNKAEVYPEEAPAAYFNGRRPDDVITAYERARPLLEAAGVDFYDGPELYDQWKREGRPYLFARSGTHWSYDSAVRVLQAVRENLNPRMRRPIPELTVLSRRLGPPQRSDRDLLNVVNLLRERRYEGRLPDPILKHQTAIASEDLPRILWVHDSFGYTLIDLLYAANAVQPSESLFYFKTCYRLPGGLPTGIDVQKIEWNSFLEPYDAVVMVWTDIGFMHKGLGFFETLDRDLH